MNPKVLVLGGRGMLGSAVVRKFESLGIPVGATARDARVVTSTNTAYTAYTVGGASSASLFDGLGPGDYVLNCIGVIKHVMSDSNRDDRVNAIRVNSEFPHELAGFAEDQGFRVVQIATDCVFSGSIGSYDEASPHDAGDVYGQTKSLGEVPSPQFLHLRCSIIGRELKGKRSLVEWLLSQPQGGSIQGYLDHRWNGVTTACFADVAVGLIRSASSLSGTFHLVPADTVNKDELSRMVLRYYGRDDVTVVPTVTGDGIDRTLTTQHSSENLEFWARAGYAEPPTIEQMVASSANPF